MKVLELRDMYTTANVPKEAWKVSTGSKVPDGEHRAGRRRHDRLVEGSGWGELPGSRLGVGVAGSVETLLTRLY